METGVELCYNCANAIDCGAWRMAIFEGRTIDCCESFEANDGRDDDAED